MAFKFSDLGIGELFDWNATPIDANVQTDKIRPVSTTEISPTEVQPNGFFSFLDNIGATDFAGRAVDAIQDKYIDDINGTVPPPKNTAEEPKPISLFSGMKNKNGTISNNTLIYGGIGFVSLIALIALAVRK